MSCGRRHDLRCTASSVLRSPSLFRPSPSLVVAAGHRTHCAVRLTTSPNSSFSKRHIKTTSSARVAEEIPSSPFITLIASAPSTSHGRLLRPLSARACGRLRHHATGCAGGYPQGFRTSCRDVFERADRGPDVHRRIIVFEPDYTQSLPVSALYILFPYMRDDHCCGIHASHVNGPPSRGQDTPYTPSLVFDFSRLTICSQGVVMTDSYGYLYCIHDRHCSVALMYHV